MANNIKPISFILSLLKEKKNFKFISNFGNLGDAFIATSTYVLFDKNNLSYEIASQPNIDDPTVVFADSGRYCGIYDYKYLIDFLKISKASEIIFLPNTFHNCDDLISLFDERFTIFCRDEKSYNYVKEKVKKAKIYLANDMAFNFCESDLKQVEKENFDTIPLGKRYALWNYVLPLHQNIQNFKLKNQTFKVSYLMRNDNEQIKNQKKPSCSFDLSGCYLGNYTHKPSTSWLFKLFYCSILCSDIIVTNRLHVGIMAEKLGKETILLDNNYGKVSSIWKMSMQNMENVHLIDKSLDIEKYIYQIIQNKAIMHTANDKEFFNLNPVPEAQLYC